MSTNASSAGVNASNQPTNGSAALQNSGANQQSLNGADILNQSKDFQTMVSVLKDMGIEEFEPRVINQLLEFSYRYITNLLEDAKAFSNHAGKKNIDSEDIKMAIKSKVDYSFTTTPPRDLLMEISKSKNKNPLPPIKISSGIRLPPDRFCLHAPNYILKSQNMSSDSGRMSDSYFGQHGLVNQQQTSRQHNNQSIPQQQTTIRNDSFMPSNLSIKRPRADEDDYDC